MTDHVSDSSISSTDIPKISTTNENGSISGDSTTTENIVQHADYTINYTTPSANIEETIDKNRKTTAETITRDSEPSTIFIATNDEISRQQQAPNLTKQ